MCANANGRIPKAEARRLLESHRLSQVIIIARTQQGAQVCVSDGLTIRDRENAQAAAEIWDLVMKVGQRKGPSLLEILRRAAG